MRRLSNCCTYAIRCKENGKLYIGSSTSVDTRFFAHVYDLRRGNKAVSNPEWQDDFRKYGEDAFEVWILEEGVDYYNDRRERESYWIDKYRAREPEYGYNKRIAERRQAPINNGLPPMADGGAI